MDIKDKELHRVATTAIIYNADGKFLITKRAMHKKHFPGKWTVPGGGLSTDDYTDKPLTGPNQWHYALTDALRREVTEEVGLEIGKPEYLWDLTFIKADGIPVLVISFFAQYVSGDVVLDEDATEFAWIEASEIPQYDLIGGIDKEIQMVDDILKERKHGK